VNLFRGHGLRGAWLDHAALDGNLTDGVDVESAAVIAAKDRYSARGG
jgi:hypothetical protein